MTKDSPKSASAAYEDKESPGLSQTISNRQHFLSTLSVPCVDLAGYSSADPEDADGDDPSASETEVPVPHGIHGGHVFRDRSHTERSIATSPEKICPHGIQHRPSFGIPCRRSSGLSSALPPALQTERSPSAQVAARASGAARKTARSYSVADVAQQKNLHHHLQQPPQGSIVEETKWKLYDPQPFLSHLLYKDHPPSPICVQGGIVNRSKDSSRKQHMHSRSKSHDERQTHPFHLPGQLFSDVSNESSSSTVEAEDDDSPGPAAKQRFRPIHFHVPGAPGKPLRDPAREAYAPNVMPQESELSKSVHYSIPEISESESESSLSTQEGGVSQAMSDLSRRRSVNYETEVRRAQERRDSDMRFGPESVLANSIGQLHIDPGLSNRNQREYSSLPTSPTSPTGPFRLFGTGHYRPDSQRSRVSQVEPINESESDDESDDTDDSETESAQTTTNRAISYGRSQTMPVQRIGDSGKMALSEAEKMKIPIGQGPNIASAVLGVNRAAGAAGEQKETDGSGANNTTTEYDFLRRQSMIGEDEAMNRIGSVPTSPIKIPATMKPDDGEDKWMKRLERGQSFDYNDYRNRFHSTLMLPDEEQKPGFSNGSRQHERGQAAEAATELRGI
ncbi:uncharacterized protein V1516DRAFT_686978 [Lipomyces oligophaga]|uniref:uncharacterized protein n=1 Tax=Lipomyces oligophaga TaxID=45792 RepID=UPI0034CE6371